MPRVLLIHWNDRESDERVERLRALGLDARAPEKRNGAAIRTLGDDPPDAVVIDLDRSPTEGRAVAVMLRNQVATRRIPIVFVAGQPERVARVRAILPDAAYAEWDGIADAIRAAIAAPPVDPVVPGTMDAYSGTPLPRKLGIRPGTRVLLFDAPRGFEATLGPVPDGARVSRAPVGPVAGTVRVAILFARSVADLEAAFARAAASLDPKGTLWIAWPKRTSRVATDLSEAGVRSFGLGRGFVDFKIASIDQAWSGLRFARRSRTG
jgi:CheY-like chemotaxis protein